MGRQRKGLREISFYVGEAEYQVMMDSAKAHDYTLAVWAARACRGVIKRMQEGPSTPRGPELLPREVEQTPALVPARAGNATQRQIDDARARLREIDEESVANQDPDDLAELQQEAAQLRTLLKSLFPPRR